MREESLGWEEEQTCRLTNLLLDSSSYTLMTAKIQEQEAQAVQVICAWCGQDLGQGELKCIFLDIVKEKENNFSFSPPLYRIHLPFLKGLRTLVLCRYR